MTKPTGLQYHLATGNAWTDITPYVLYSSNPVDITRGRQDQFSTVQTGTLTATLDNSDGRFAPGDGYKLGINWITNPRFQVNLTGWTPSANLTAAWDPTPAAKLTATSTAALTYQFTATLPTDAPGKKYTLTGLINATGTVIGKTVTQKVEFYDGASALISTITRSGAVTLVSGNQTVSMSAVVPPGAVTAKVFPVFVPGGWAVNDSVLLDNCCFTDYDAGLYFDGAQITVASGLTYSTTPRDAQGFWKFVKWNGVADASTSTLLRAAPYVNAVSGGAAVGGMATDTGIRVRFPDTNNHNLAATPDDASFEGGTIGSWAAIGGWGTLSNSAVRAWDGTKSLLITSSTTGGQASTPVPVTCGLTYTMQVRVWVLAGQPDVNFELINGLIPKISTSLKAQWVTMTQTFVVPFGLDPATVKPEVWWASGSVAGQQVWVDGFHMWEGSTAPPAFITGPGPTYQYKYSGYLTAIPVQWPGGSSYSQVQITAADRLAPLGRDSFRSVVQEEILYDKPTVYYTLGEPSGSTSAGDASGNGQPPLQTLAKGTAGSVTFGTGTGPPTDGLPAVQFIPSNTTNFKYLAVKFPQSLSKSFDDKTIVATFNTATSPAQRNIWRVFDQSRTYTMALGIDDSFPGQLILTWGTSTSVTTLVSPGPGRWDDGRTHQVAIVISGGAPPNITINMYVDGVFITAVTTNTGYTIPSLSCLQVGGDVKSTAPFNGTMSHVAVFPSALTSARLVAQSAAQKDGFLNERSDQRIARYARWAGVDPADQALEVGKLTTTDHLDTAGQSPTAAIESVATTEGGLSFVDRAGKLAFHSRAHRWDAAPFITLTADDVGRDTQFVLDNQQLVNQVTSSSMTVANLVVANSASIAAHGVYPVTLQLLSTSTDDVTFATQWYATVNANPKPRTGTILIDLLTSPQAVSDLFKKLEIGDTFAISGLPIQSPAYDTILCVEGWKETISATEWSVLINTSTAVPMWRIEDPVYGGVDSVNRIAF